LKLPATNTDFKNLSNKHRVYFSNSNLLSFIFDLSNIRLNFHTGALIGFSSLLWAGHLVHLAIPVSRGLTYLPILNIYDFYTGRWNQKQTIKG
jgi:hypothetical protein